MTLVVDSVDTNAADLTVLAAEIRHYVTQGRQGLLTAIDANFAIGHRLEAARRQLPGDREFGRWCRSEDISFSQPWRALLLRAAANESRVRGVLNSQLLGTGRPNFEKAVQEAAVLDVASRPALAVVTEATGEDPAAEPTIFPTIVIDPPWQYGNKATRGAAEDHYPTMSMDELRELEVPAADNAHLYLWVTNPFMREGLDLCDEWGFTYKTLLTWVKPQMGMGNYFRGSTEHVIFGMRGRLPTLRNDVVNWFKADRRRHSAKPDCFYDLVESSSPGPYLEMFSRTRRLGWHGWGNEA